MRVVRDQYTFAWDQGEDVFTLTDPQGRLMVSSPMQPAIVVSSGWSIGTVSDVAADEDRLQVTYDGVNGSGSVSVAWRFEPTRCWLEPIAYASTADEDVVSLHYFARPDLVAGDEPMPGLLCRYLIHPGISGSPAITPVINMQARLDLTSWLGRGGQGRITHRQQWGLPVHYLAGQNSTAHPVDVGAMTNKVSDAFCLGLADLPQGDLFLRTAGERTAPMVQIRSDLWGHVSGPGTHELGASMMWAFGPTYEAAIRSYYAGLVESGAVAIRPSSPGRDSVSAASQANTWGAQLTTGLGSQLFNQHGLEEIHKQLIASGLESQLFVVDDKWEGEYGTLEHDQERFPQFEKVLDDIRGQGRRIGIWAAFLRCDHPASVGLTTDDLLRDVNGEPIVLGPLDAPYFLFDVTRPGVPGVLTAGIERFVARYRPVLVKFDFGYEIPDVSVCAPYDKHYAGERYLKLALEIATEALRAADPEIVVMYNSLSPLFTPYVDLHGTDDPWMAQGEYHAEMNRRMYFSRQLAELGTPTYGSGGYDWTNQVDIWFDSVAMGSLGMLGSFAGDQSDSVLTPQQVAIHNGLNRLTREVTQFRVEAIGASGLGSVTGGRSSSWVRYEDDEAVLMVLRPGGFFGAPGVRGFGIVVQTDVDIAVGPLDAAPSLDAAERLGVVVRGPGRFVLSTRADTATVTMHAFDGAQRVVGVRAARGMLYITVPDAVDESPVSWIEIARGDADADH